ncbi:hypothetical protein EDB86DRAFT_2266444 [Lactarius hatsudake]|nr:hypothetical protein EDB86DRAFT_2266444 [Lactarius hatsudake]
MSWILVGLLLFVRSRRDVLVCAIMSTGMAHVGRWGRYSRARSAGQADLDCDPVIFSGKQDTPAHILRTNNRSEDEHEGNTHRIQCPVSRRSSSRHSLSKVDW